MTIAVARLGISIDTEGGAARGLSLGSVAIVAVSALVYSSGSFMFAEVIGIKRVLQIALVTILLAAACLYGARMPLRRINTLMLFVLALIGSELVMRGKVIFLFDAASSLLALIVIFCVPPAIFWFGARVVVWTATTFAIMALIQWVILFYVPDLGDYRLFIDDDGVILNSVKHPILYLGLFGEQQFTLFNRSVARLQSFALEPSLNVVYFMLPATLGMLLKQRIHFIAGGVILLFCALSLSGSVFLSVVFSVLWIPLLWVVPLRYAFSYGLLLVLGLYIYVIMALGFDSMLAGLSSLSQFGDFFGKSTSLTVRGLAAIANFQSIFSSPLGSSSIADMAGPWPINGALAAGWLGLLFIVLFLRRLGLNVQKMNQGHRFFSRTRMATIVLLGAMSTIVVFNDYQMSNYAGLALIAFIARAIDLRNSGDDESESPKSPVSIGN